LSTVDVETPTNEDFDWLTMIIKEFVEKTGSEVGETILKDWQNASRRFVKVYW
jgi:glutamate synthase domain-containing protein 3